LPAVIICTERARPGFARRGSQRSIRVASGDWQPQPVVFIGPKPGTDERFLGSTHQATHGAFRLTPRPLQLPRGLCCSPSSPRLWILVLALQTISINRRKAWVFRIGRCRTPERRSFHLRPLRIPAIKCSMPRIS
jgi:hypothetical protein